MKEARERESPKEIWKREDVTVARRFALLEAIQNKLPLAPR